MDGVYRKKDSGVDAAQLRRLYHWLSYNRYTIFLYGGGIYLPWALILLALIVLAAVFAPYLLYVLYKNGNHGWLAAFAIMVGIPVVLAFLSTGNAILDTCLHFLPLLAFYFYCFVLRFSVSEWVGDDNPVDQLWNDEEDRQNKLNL